jgi:hypothetical protein
LDFECSLDLSTDATKNVSSALTTDTWHHVAMSWTDDSDDEITLWVDGQVVGTSTDGVGGTSADSTALIIGNDSASATATFDGLIDAFNIFSYELTEKQIQMEYNGASAVHF